MKHLVCIGFGFSAQALASRLRAEGWRITGTSRSEDGAANISAEGIDAVVFEAIAHSEALANALATATHILVSVPPAESGDPVLLTHQDEIAAARNLKWIGYLSTIGVYGDHDGAWVDETTPATPLSQRSKRRLEAEQAWLEFGRNIASVRQDDSPRVQIFRLAGIYGPGRSAIDQIQSGRARSIVKTGQVFNRIHVEDIAGAIEAAIARDCEHAIFNVTDDEPSPPQEVNAFAAKLIGREAPPEVAFEEAELSAMARSFYSETKRVRNDRLKTELKYQLKYPSYREGLAAIAHLYGYRDAELP